MRRPNVNVLRFARRERKQKAVWRVGGVWSILIIAVQCEDITRSLRHLGGDARVKVEALRDFVKSGKNILDKHCTKGNQLTVRQT
jgi:hypothetical protein